MFSYHIVAEGKLSCILLQINNFSMWTMIWATLFISLNLMKLNTTFGFMLNKSPGHFSVLCCVNLPIILFLLPPCIWILLKPKAVGHTDEFTAKSQKSLSLSPWLYVCVSVLFWSPPWLMSLSLNYHMSLHPAEYVSAFSLISLIFFSIERFIIYEYLFFHK